MFSKIICVRKVYQMTVLSLVLVALTALIVVVSIAASAPAPDSDVEVVECEEVQITINVRETDIQLDWNENLCAMGVQILHHLDGVLHNTLTIPAPIISTSLERVDCSENEVTINVIPMGVDPPNPGIETFNVGFIGDSGAQNINFNADEGRFEWDAPNMPTGCRLEYEVRFRNDFVTLETNTTFEFYEAELPPCSNNFVTVTTLIGIVDERGDSVDSGQTGPTTRLPANHVSTDPHQTHAEVTWHVLLEERNLCEVQELRYEVTAVDTTDPLSLSRDFDENIDLLFTLTPLESDIRYQYKVCYIFSGSEVVICSDVVPFITDPLPNPSVDVTASMDSNFYISWQQDYHSEFVTGHTLRIVPIAHNHFVPDECVEDLDLSTFEEFFLPGVKSYHFEFALSSFRYKVQIDTHFETLGMTTSSEESVFDTDETEPGPLHITSTYQYVPSSPYSVSLMASWDIPCDVNGKVRSFSYLVTGTPKSDLTISCDAFVLASNIIEITEELENQKTHSISVPGVLPFFQYSLVVTTTTTYTGDTPVDLGDAPPAYNAPQNNKYQVKV